MNSDLDPIDDMPSRAALAQEVLVYRMRMLSETFYTESWVEDLEFDVWDMAHVSPPKFGEHAVTESTAKSFRDLATLGGGWWVWPEVVGREGDREIFIPLDEWQQCLAKRSATKYI